jgi:hypothetical protein
MERDSRLMERRVGRAVPDLGPRAALAVFIIFVSPVAAQTDRVIRLKDGRVFPDEPTMAEAS